MKSFPFPDDDFFKTEEGRELPKVQAEDPKAEVEVPKVEVEVPEIEAEDPKAEAEVPNAGVGTPEIEKEPEAEKETPPLRGSAVPASAQRGNQETERLDPILRIGRLNAANNEVISIAPGSSLNHATTLMMLKDFSQLPIIQGSILASPAMTTRPSSRASVSPPR